MRQYKIVVVGDGTVGKTSLLSSYIDNQFGIDYERTVFDNKETNIRVNDVDHFAILFDTAGQEELSSVRPLSYQQTDLFIICFCINSDSSFSHISSRWIPELSHHQPNVPFIVVGTKQDLRGETLLKGDTDLDRTDGMRTEEFYNKQSKSWGAKAYLECSAKTRFNIEYVFETAISVSNENKVDHSTTQLKENTNCCTTT